MDLSAKLFSLKSSRLARSVAIVISLCVLGAACTPPDAPAGEPVPTTEDLAHKPPKTTVPPTTAPPTTTTAPTTTTPPPTTTTTTRPTTTTTTRPTPPTTTTRPPSYSFVDEFSGASGARPDPTKWWANPWCENDPNYMTMCQNPANAFLDGNGNLVLRVSAGTMGRPYDGAQVNGFERGAWPPSKVLASVAPPVHIEARIKLPNGTSLWPSFWPESVDPKFAELDIMEARMLNPTVDTIHVHGFLEWNSAIDTGVDLTAGFHVYWADYYPDRITFGFDNTTIATAPFPSGAPRVGMVLGNGVGAPDTWGGVGGPPAASALPADMLVDYVRAWAI